MGASVTYSLHNNLHVYVGGQAFRGNNGSLDTGDLQVYSNIDAARFNQLYEVWVESTLLDGTLRIKAGQIDANSEFAYPDSAGEFINSSMGFSPTISFLPTYPEPSLGLTGFYRFTEHQQVSLGVFSDSSNQFDEVFVITQYAFNNGKYIMKVGHWSYSQQVANLANPAKFGDASGVYTTVEGQLALTKLANFRPRWYAQAAYSSPRYNQVTQHFGMGMILHDVFDQIGNSVGLGVSHIKTSNHAGFSVADSETTIEAFYKMLVYKNVTLKPNIQYILSPAAAPDVDNALVFTLRVAFSW